MEQAVLGHIYIVIYKKNKNILQIKLFSLYYPLSFLCTFMSFNIFLEICEHLLDMLILMETIQIKYLTFQYFLYKHVRMILQVFSLYWLWIKFMFLIVTEFLFLYSTLISEKSLSQYVTSGLFMSYYYIFSTLYKPFLTNILISNFSSFFLGDIVSRQFHLPEPYVNWL